VAELARRDRTVGSPRAMVAGATATRAGSVLDVQLLGHPRVRLGDVGVPPSALPVLAYLALGRHRWHVRTVVAANLSPGSDEHRARQRLNTVLWRLRRWLTCDCGSDDTVVFCRDGAIRFDPDLPFRLDVAEFESAVCPLVDQPDPLSREAVMHLEEGVTLYRGDLLDGCYDEWVLSERARLSDLHLAAIHRLITWHRSHGDTAKVTRYGEEALRREPFREDVHRELIAAYAEAGQRQRALDQFERCRRLLAAELDVDPMPETLALVGRIRCGNAPSGAAPARPDLQQLAHELSAMRRQLTDLAEIIDRSLAAISRQVGPTTATS
jgi:DNA-binding SARP family transcriptional activator